MAGNETSRRESIRERIYADLRRRVRRCELDPEDRLVDVEIARAYGASRMPAREALLQLVNEGYLVGTSRGFALPTLSMQEVRDVFEVRKLLEPRAAALAAGNLDAASEEALDAALAEAQAAMRADDVARLIRANVDFRDAWVARVRNVRLAETLARFVDHVQTVRREMLACAKTRRVVLEGIEDLRAAFATRDPVVAGDRMASFISAAERAYFSARGAA
ncbi:GntR family transcriptional regulator [Salinarimonas rosea]|uniref:GntR family transcriptional regulator n=1 Tax=Salinarimonas rosea TaxID=552063 RepID=UPI0004203101|nr:GntR family transcriptional regulator [Salinarimonas rosea]